MSLVASEANAPDLAPSMAPKPYQIRRFEQNEKMKQKQREEYPESDPTESQAAQKKKAYREKQKERKRQEFERKKDKCHKAPLESSELTDACPFPDPFPIDKRNENKVSESVHGQKLIGATIVFKDSEDVVLNKTIADDGTKTLMAGIAKGVTDSGGSDDVVAPREAGKNPEYTTPEKAKIQNGPEPREITSQPALQILDKPIPEDVTPDANSILEDIKKWCEIRGHPINEFALKILDCDPATYENLVEKPPKSWEKSGIWKSSFQRMYNWVKNASEKEKIEMMEMDLYQFSDGNDSEATSPIVSSTWESKLTEALAILEEYGASGDMSTTAMPRSQQMMPRGTPRKSLLVHSPEETKRRRLEEVATPSGAPEDSRGRTPQLKSVSAILQSPSATPQKSPDGSFAFYADLSGPHFAESPHSGADEFRLDVGYVDLSRNYQEHFRCPTCCTDIGYFSNYGDHICDAEDARKHSKEESVNQDSRREVVENVEKLKVLPQNPGYVTDSGDETTIVAGGGLTRKIHKDLLISRQTDAFADGGFRPLANSTIVIREAEAREHAKNPEDSRGSEGGEKSNLYESTNQEPSTPFYNNTI